MSERPYDYKPLGYGEELQWCWCGLSWCREYDGTRRVIVQHVPGYRERLENGDCEE